MARRITAFLLIGALSIAFLSCAKPSDDAVETTDTAATGYQTGVSDDEASERPTLRDGAGAKYGDGGYILGLEAGVTAGEIVALFEDDVTVTERDGRELASDESVGTGAVVASADGKRAIVLIPGDVNGDGAADEKDAAAILARALFGNAFGKSAFDPAAADVNGDGKISAKDALEILEKSSGASGTDKTETNGGAKGGNGDTSPESEIPTVTVIAPEVHEGDESVEVTLSIAGNPGICSIMLSVDFDERLTLTNVSFDPAFGSYVTAPEPYASPQALSVISPLEAIGANGTLATLTFALDPSLAPGDAAAIKLSVDRENTFDENLSDVSFEVINADVVVK